MGKAITTGEAIPNRYWVNAVSGIVHRHQAGQQFSVYGVAHPSASRIVSKSQAQTADEHSQAQVCQLLQELNLDWQPSKWDGLYVASLDTELSEDPVLPELNNASNSYNAAEQNSAESHTQPITGRTLERLVRLSHEVNLHLKIETELEWIVCQPIRSPQQGAEPHQDQNPENTSFDVYVTQVLPSGLNRGDRNARSHTESVQAPEPHPSDVRNIASRNIYGMGAAPGEVTAKAWVVAPKTSINAGTIASPMAEYILIASDVVPDWMSLIQQSRGIVSERGGMTCHAAVIARELGIPAVVGVSNATRTVRTGDLITLNGDRGTIRLHAQNSPGQITSVRPDANTDSEFNTQLTTADSEDHSEIHSEIQSEIQSKFQAPPKFESIDFASADHTANSELIISDTSPVSPPSDVWQRMLTQLTTSDRPNATQLMASLSQAEALPRLGNLPCDGIGLLRAEMAILPLLDQQSPQQWIEQGNADVLCQRIALHILPFAEAVSPRPMYYRTLDVRSHDFGSLFSSESNPEAYDLLGIHGTWSYQLDPTMFRVELSALRRIQHRGMDNIRLILPFVRTVEEFKFCHQQVVEAGLYDSSNFQLWIMAEVPSVMFLLEDYVKAGVDGIAIGTNDLTQLLLGIDRDHPHMQSVFNQNHPAIQRALRHLVQTARQLKIPCSICGQAPIQHPELIASLVQWGITAICVSPASIPQAYRAIARAERSMLLDVLRQSHRPLDL